MSARTTFAAITLFALSAAPFAALASSLYAVTAELSHRGEVFAAPSAVVRNGEPASVEVSGTTGYKLALTVKELAQDKIEVAAAVDSSHGSMAPIVVLQPDVPASIQIGEMGLKLTVNRSGG